jgi:hypothetical protein
MVGAILTRTQRHDALERNTFGFAIRVKRSAGFVTLAGKLR